MPFPARTIVPAVESLEPRRLLSSTLWGSLPRLIDQDAADLSYGDITGAGQTIAFLDTGINYNRAALGGGFGPGFKVIGGYDFVDNDNNPMDADGHGTGVAAVAAGTTWTYDDSTYRGISPGAKIVALRIDNGSGDVPDARYQAALQWIIANRVAFGITVVNISEGGDQVFSARTTNNSLYADELATLKAAGVFIAVASGNDGVTSPPGIEYPAADPSVFSVGSSNLNDDVADHTSRSPILDILAPGQNVITYYRDGNGNWIITPATGTSWAAPHVAGAAALLKQINPAFSPDDIMGILQATAQDVWDPATSHMYKRLDLDGALEYAKQLVGQSRPSLGADGLYQDLAFARDGRLHLAYYDASDTSLKYAVRSAEGNWSLPVTVDYSGDVGRFASIAIDRNNEPGIAYYDRTNADLKYAHLSGVTWTLKRVDAAGKTGLRPSLAYDTASYPAFSYYDASRQDLRFTQLTSSGWLRQTVDSKGDVGTTSSLVYNKKTRQWNVAYEQTTSGLYRFAARSATKNRWSISTVDDTLRGGGHISLTLDKSYRPAFSYYDSYAKDLKFAHYNGSRWRTTTVASTGIQGLYTSLAFDADGANIVYYDQSRNKIYLAVGGIGAWNYALLLNDAGQYTSAALSPLGELSLAFNQNWSNAIHFIDF